MEDNINKGLYVISGIKNYPPYLGDTASDTIKILVVANSEEHAKTRVKDQLDKINNVKFIYPLNDSNHADIIYIL